MSPDYEAMLCKPNLSLFPNARLVNGQYFWGFGCQDGWFDLLNNALSLVYARCEIASGCEQVIVEEVKEKFGVLRICYRGGDDFVTGVFNLAEAMSVNICVICGTRVGNRRMHYHHPRCDLHYDD
ncbi:hypothetical protein [Pseudomonas sp. HLT2-19-2]